MKWLWIPLLVALPFTYGIAWDGGFQLHPDERWITFTLENYSPEWFASRWYVYGLLPLQLARFAHELFPLPWIYLQRGISLVSFLGIVGFTAALARRLADDRAGLVAGLLAATSVGLIQNAHFGCVDEIGIFFIIAALYYRDSAIFGFLCGAAACCKINFAIVLLAAPYKPPARLLLAMLAALVTFRLSQWNAFNAGFALNGHWIDGLRQQYELAQPDVFYPPSVQWFENPWWNAALDLRWGMGTIPALFGMGSLLLASRIRGCRPSQEFRQLQLLGLLFLLIAWSAPNHFLRYALPAYPLLAIFAAVVACQYPVMGQLSVACSILWALRFSWAVFYHEHTLIQAAKWMVSHYAGGTVVYEGPWTDKLPGIRFPDEQELGCFEPSPKFDLLRSARYFIITSNRCTGTVARLASRFPLQAKFYKALEAGEAGFRLIKEFDAGLGDESADESFSVYDHPHVEIWENLNPTIAP